MTEYRALKDDETIMDGDEFFGWDGRWVPSKEVGTKVTTYNYKLYRRPLTETSSQTTDNTTTNTDTCPDCSNHPCDCGLPAGYEVDIRFAANFAPHIKGVEVSSLIEVMQQRDELLRYNEAYRQDALICANCDAISKKEYDQAIEQRDRLADLVKQFIYILDITEESDGGRLFHPTNITSCRAGDLQKIGELVEALRRASRNQPTNRTMNTLKQTLDNKGYTYTEADGKINVTHQGNVDLRSLTTLPEGTSFNNQGSVNLSSLTTEMQTYRGEQITLRYIDGYTMLIESEKITKGITVCKARYFGGGEIKDLKQCYVAKVGNHWAHGKTAKEAIQDAIDKATLDADVADVVAEIKRTGMVTITQYRAITGACREGCRQFLTSIGKPDATELPLTYVIQQVKGHYGFDRFEEAINQPTEP